MTSLVKSLQTYSAIHKRISNVNLHKMMGHFWFLSEELAALASFDYYVTNNTKQEIVNAMLHLGPQGEEDSPKLATVDIQLL